MILISFCANSDSCHFPVKFFKRAEKMIFWVNLPPARPRVVKGRKKFCCTLDQKIESFQILPVSLRRNAENLKILANFLNFLVKFGLIKDVLVHILQNQCMKVDMLHTVEKLRLCSFQWYRLMYATAKSTALNLIRTSPKLILYYETQLFWATYSKFMHFEAKLWKFIISQYNLR